MTHKEIQDSCIKVIKDFGIDFSEDYQSISINALSDMRKVIPRTEIIEAFKAMEGVVLDFSDHHMVRIPTHYFVK